MLTELHEHCLRLTAKSGPKAFLISTLSDIEAKLAVGTSEKMQLGGLVGIFQTAKMALG